MKKPNMEHIIEYGKTILCIVLFVTMLVQALVYFAYTKKMSAAWNDDLRSLLVLKSGESVVSGTRNYSQYLHPSFIGIKHFDVQRGLSAGSEAISTVYDMINPLIALLTGKDYFCEKISTDSAQIWESCFDRENYIYLRYHGDLLLQTLRFFAVGEQTMDFTNSCIGDTFLVRELMILPDATSSGTFTITAIARGSDGSLARLVPIQAYQNYYVSLGTIFAVIFNNSYFYDFTFQREDPRDYGALTLPDQTVFSEERFTLYPIQCTLPNSGYFENTEISAAVLRLFSFNPDKLYSYTEQDGSVTCVESFGVFRAESRGKIEFSAVGERQGISISQFLDYSDYDESYDIFELMAASCTIVDSLRSYSKDLFSGSADVCLREIRRSGEDLVFSFVYTYDNVPILDSSSHMAEAFTVTYHEGFMTSFTANCADYSPYSTKMENYAQDWICMQYADSLDEIHCAEMLLAYVPLQNEENRYISDWIFLPLT